MRSPTHQGGSSSPPRAATKYKGESSQQVQHFTPSWVLSSSNPPRPIYDDNGVMWVPYQQAIILDGEDQDQLWTKSPGLSKTNWLLAILVRIIRPDRSDWSLALARPV
jgi:hypothetical protein